MNVKRWTSPNDANHRNRHAEVLGVEFFAFPFQSLRARVGGRSAQVSEKLILADPQEQYSAQCYTADKKCAGYENLVKHHRFSTQDDALLWAATWIKEGK